MLADSTEFLRYCRAGINIAVPYNIVPIFSRKTAEEKIIRRKFTFFSQLFIRLFFNRNLQQGTEALRCMDLLLTTESRCKLLKPCTIRRRRRPAFKHRTEKIERSLTTLPALLHV